MSRINTRGQAMAGVGDGVITIDGAIPLPLRDAIGGGGGWLGLEECGYQRKIGPGPDDYICQAYHLATGRTRTLAERGANTLRCDGEGRWATWRPGEGVRDEQDRRWPKAALLDYDRGTLVICQDQQAGRGIQLLRDGKVVQEIATGGLGTDASEGPNVRLVDGVLAYQADGVYHLVGGPSPYRPPAAPVYMVPVPLADGRVAVLEHDATRLYLRWPDNLSRGRMIDEAGGHFSAQARQRDDGQIVVTWWRGSSCLPQEFKWLLIDPSELLLDDLTATPPARVAPFTRPVWLAPFHATRHGQSVVCPGHAEIITDGQDANARVSRRPVIADLASENSVDDLLAMFALIHDGKPGELERARAVADRRGVPVIAYWDERTLFPLDRVDVRVHLRPNDWLGVQLYCEPSESVADFREGSRRQVAHAAASGHPVCLVVQMFDRNGKELDRRKLSALQPLWRELAEAFPSVLAIAPFAVIRDKYGVTAYPELQAWLSAYGGAMTAPTRAQTPEPGTQNPGPIPPREPLAVEVDEYTSTGTAPMEVTVHYRITGAGNDPVRVSMLLNGQQVAGSDQPHGRITTVLEEPGEYRLKLRVTSGDRVPAETGAPRVVRVNARPEAPPPQPPAPPVDADPAVHLNRTAAADTVRLLYLDVLKREPDPDGLAHYVDALMAGTLDSAGLRTILTNAKDGGAK